MSGHSKWSQIKHKKAITDAKKSKIFGKLARVITLATRDKGGNPDTNAALRLAIENARSFNMPTDNIERAIKRGTGEIEGAAMEEVSYDAYGPGNVALIVKGITDNKNRTLSEVRHILTQYGGKLAEGGVSWLFDRKGVIEISANENSDKTKENLEMLTIEAGAEDIIWKENILNIYVQPENLEAVKNNLEKAGLKIASVLLDLIPKTPIEITDEKIKNQLEKLLDALDEHDDVNEIYTNAKNAY